MTAIPLRRIEGKYEILEKLGEGGMGAVYKVRHRLLDEIRVIKVMRQQLLEEEDLKARFYREARVAIQLRHPSIAQLYDFSLDEDDIAFIVMEYIEGITLENLLLHQGPPPLALGLEIAQQTLKALNYLHTKGFVHRDISPDNLMLSEGPDGDPLVKLIDLGIAKTLDAGAGAYLTQTGTFLGKVRYAPPEQFGEAGASAMDGRGDLYAFGVVLYELLTGRYPIRGRDPSSLIAGHLFWPPMEFAESDPEGRVPEGVRGLVLRALAKKPEERFATAQEMARALAAFRTPSDLDGLELRAFLRPPVNKTVRLRAPAGSTQDRLDHQFGLRPTPSPSKVAEITQAFLSGPVPVPPPEMERPFEAVGGSGFTEVLSQVEEKIARGDYKVAELMLYEAEVDFGAHAEFTALHERLAEERRREMAAKAEARQRAEQIAAAVAEIQARLNQGQLDRAGEILDQTLSSFGDDTISGELRSRIRELREQAQEAERAALLDAGRERFDMGDLEGALEAARQVETLAPNHAEARALRAEVAAEMRRREEEEARRLAEEARLRAEEEARLRAEAEEARRREEEEVKRREEEARKLAEEARLREEEEARLRAEAEEAKRREEEEARRREEEARKLAEEARLRAEEEARLRAEAEEARRREEEEAKRRKEEAARKLAEEARLREEEEARLRAEAEEARRREEEEAKRRKEEAARKLAEEARLRAEEEARLRAEAEEARRREKEEAKRRKEEAARKLAEEARLRKEEEARLRAEAEEARRRQEEEARLREEEAARLRAEEARRREEEARREAARVAALAEIDARLQAEKLEETAVRLAQAVADFGDDPLLRERWERLAAARIEQQRRAEADRRAKELAAALATIDDCLTGGRLEEAARLLPAAVANFGGESALRERWERLESLWKTQSKKRPG